MPVLTRSYEASIARGQDVGSHEAQLGRCRPGVVRVLLVYLITALALVAVIFACRGRCRVTRCRRSSTLRPDYAHNPAEANRLLDALGLVDRNGDRFRDLPDGSTWVQELKTSNRFSPKTPELIGEYLRAVGVNTRVVMLDRAAADEAGVQGDYTMQLHGYGGIMGDPDTLRTRFSSQVRSRSFNRAHGYVNERFDQLAQQQLATIDESPRRDLLAQMQRIIAEDLPVLPLYVPDRILFFDRNVFTNWYYTPGCSPCRGSRNKHMYVTGQKVGFEGGARR